VFLYLYMWCLASFASIAPVKFEKNLRYICAFFFSCILVIVIGLRFKIGGDWDAYFGMVQDATSLEDAISRTEPAYGVLNFIANQTNLGVAFVNLICAFLFVYGLVRFSFAQPLPWLAISIAIPYLLIVVAMGYTRQSVAIGLVMLAYLSLAERKITKFIAEVIFASLFHKSAIVLLLLGLLSKDFLRSKLRFFLVAILVIPVFYVLALRIFESQWGAYVDGAMNSEGGFVRSLMNAIPAAFLILFGERFRAKWGGEYPLYRKIAFLSIASVFLVSVAPTAVDRFSLYFIPLQIFVFSRLPLIFKGEWRVASLIFINIFYGTVLLYWLHNSYYAKTFWLPYKSYLF